MGAHLKFLKHGIESGEDPFGRPSFDDVSEALGQTDRDELAEGWRPGERNVNGEPTRFLREEAWELPMEDESWLCRDAL